MAFCEECGNPISAQAKFCSVCGKKIGNIDEGEKTKNIQLPTETPKTTPKDINSGSINENQGSEASIQAIDSFLTANAPQLAAGILSKFLYDPFLDMYAEFLEAYNECQVATDKNVSLRDMLLELVDRPDLGKIRRSYDSGIIEASEQPIVKFVEVLKERIQPHYSKYSLNHLIPAEQVINSEKSNILLTLRQSSATFISELGELHQRQKQVQQMQGNVLSIIEDVNYAPLAKAAGGGALALFNPFVGVPMLVAMFLEHKSKDDRTNQYLKQFEQVIDAYCLQWQETASALEDAQKKQLAYFVPKVTTMFRSALGTTFKDIAKHGYTIYSPETYFRG